jgi:hypothetical protein
MFKIAIYAVNAAAILNLVLRVGYFLLKKPVKFAFNGLFSIQLGWLMGLEPTTTGITILDSTN